MNTEIIDAGRDINGGYKVDVSRGSNVDRVSSEWFSRPDDERYLSLDDLFASVKGRAERSRTRTVESAAIRVEAHRDNPEKLELVLPGADEPIAPTHWSFGQLSSLVGAPAAYLRQLPAPLAGINLQYGLTNHRAEQIKTLETGDGRTELRAVTGPDYGRIYDHELVSAVQRIAGNGTGDSLNISSSNKGFLEKRSKLEEHTGLFLNKWFLKKENWNEAHIRERGETLADMALIIWPSISVDEIERENWDRPLDRDFTTNVGARDPASRPVGTQEPPSSGDWHIILEDQVITAKTGADALEETLRALTTGNAQRLEAVASVRGRVRPLIAQTPEALYPGRPDLTEFSREFVEGWFVGTNYSRRDVMRLIRAAAEACDLTWGVDIHVSE